MAFYFGTVSVVSLPANLLAVVAEAPVMWLGMLAAAAGQVPGLPVEPITWLAGLLAAYIAQVAAWFAAPAWAQLELPIGGVPYLAAVYAALAVGARRGRWPGRDGGAACDPPGGSGSRPGLAALVAIGLAAPTAAGALGRRRAGGRGA